MMHPSNIEKEHGRSKSSSPQRHQSNDRNHSDDDTSVKAGHRHPLRSLFRSLMHFHRPSSSKTEIKGHHHRPKALRRQTTLPNLNDKETWKNPRLNPSESTRPPASPHPQGSRSHGLLIPAYRKPTHFSKGYSRIDPILPLPTDYKQEFQEVVIRFYGCEHQSVGRDYLMSPNLDYLISATAAFIGECQLNDMPQEIQPRRPNTAYRGLELLGSHGGHHLHFPTSAGKYPCDPDIYVEWENILKNHARNFPKMAVPIAVGLGNPGDQCNTNPPFSCIMKSSLV
jgi:hypothetical protein